MARERKEQTLEERVAKHLEILKNLEVMKDKDGKLTTRLHKYLRVLKSFKFTKDKDGNLTARLHKSKLTNYSVLEEFNNLCSIYEDDILAIKDLEDMGNNALGNNALKMRNKYHKGILDNLDMFLEGVQQVMNKELEIAKQIDEEAGTNIIETHVIDNYNIERDSDQYFNQLYELLGFHTKYEDSLEQKGISELVNVFWEKNGEIYVRFLEKDSLNKNTTHFSNRLKVFYKGNDKAVLRKWRRAEKLFFSSFSISEIKECNLGAAAMEKLLKNETFREKIDRYNEKVKYLGIEFSDLGVKLPDGKNWDALNYTEKFKYANVLEAKFNFNNTNTLFDVVTKMRIKQGGNFTNMFVDIIKKIVYVAEPELTKNYADRIIKTAFMNFVNSNAENTTLWERLDRFIVDTMPAKALKTAVATISAVVFYYLSTATLCIANKSLFTGNISPKLALFTSSLFAGAYVTSRFFQSKNNFIHLGCIKT